MATILYELAGANDARFSPYCWRARMALAHKGVDVESRLVGFGEVAGIAGGKTSTVPVIVDGDTTLQDSWAIAEYLEERYPDRPLLFGGEGGKALCRFIQNWSNAVLLPQIARLVVKDVHDRVRPADQAYFQQSREKRFGQPLADVQAGREARVEAFRASLVPLRLTLASQPFLGGKSATYADHIVFGTLMWPRVGSPFALLEDADPVAEWMDRCLDLHGGLGRAMPAAS